MNPLLERFCRYVQVDTEACEASTTYPSTPGQLELGRMLAEELRALGLEDASQSEHGIVTATLPPRGADRAPTIAWFAHMDTSPETSGKNVRPIVHENYDGGDIVLPGDPGKVLRVAENPELAGMKGTTIVTTDGNTLLGGDDKAGVAVIIEAAARLRASPDIRHGPIKICFSCDEEIGRGVDHIDLPRLGAVAGYTLDGGGQAEIDVETFSADLAIVTLTGINTHPSVGMGRMINSVRLAGELLERMPRRVLSPETTCERQGFLHPYRIEGGVARTVIRVLLRDFETARLAEKADLLRTVAAQVEREHPGCRVEVAVTPQYRNMADGLGKEPRALAFAEQAMRNVGLEPKRTIVRGGTDGSRLTELGLPTPNLSCGQHNLHSPLEWASLAEMETSVRVLIELARIWGETG